LVAYSRAMRIFDRVLMQSHKYNKWATLAIESVFRELDTDDDRDYETYKNEMDASIKYEKAGDACRKRGQYDQAIAEYRAAIDNSQEYHPDAADLYCKIAIIMRQQGEFYRALEEYRFASEIYELSLGAEHPETVKTLNQLYEKKRSSQVAMALMEKLKLRS
jgi:tetratricopeptide (TPR) repeat protein